MTLTEDMGETLHTPGHTPGSMCFHLEPQNLLVAGDTLFQGSVGRTDLWGGDFKMLERSIRNRIYSLDDSIKVITGQGPRTPLPTRCDAIPLSVAKT